MLSPNEFSPKNENWSNGDQTDILIGIENYDDFTQANIDAGIVAYSVGIIYGMRTKYSEEDREREREYARARVTK